MHARGYPGSEQRRLYDEAAKLSSGRQRTPDCHAPSIWFFWLAMIGMAVIAVIVMMMIAALFATQGRAQTAAPSKTITYTLTQDQVNTLYGAMVAADFWLQVRGLGAGNTIDARGFELQRKELQALSVEMGKQANAPAAATATPVSPGGPSSSPEVKQETKQ